MVAPLLLQLMAITGVEIFQSLVEKLMEMPRLVMLVALSLSKVDCPPLQGEMFL